MYSSGFLYFDGSSRAFDPGADQPDDKDKLPAQTRKGENDGVIPMLAELMQPRPTLRMATEMMPNQSPSVGSGRYAMVARSSAPPWRVDSKLLHPVN